MMKKLFLIITISALFFACNNDIKIDDRKLDAAGKDLQKDVKKGIDTVVSKIKKMKIKVEINKDSTTH